MVRDAIKEIHKENPARPISKLALPLFLLFFNLFIFRKMGNTGFVILSLGFYIFLLASAGIKETLIKQKKLAIVSFAVIILNGLLLVNRANGFVIAVLALTDIGSILLFACLVKDRIPFVSSLFHLVVTPINFGLSYLWGGLTALEKIVATRIGEAKSDFDKKQILSTNLKSYLVGLIISIPVIFVLLNLLSGADPVFASLTKNFFRTLSNLFTGDIWQNLLNRLIISVIFGLFLSPFIYFFGKKNLISQPAFFNKLYFAREFTVVMILVAVVLGAFIIIQWPYVFVNVPFETDLSKFGVATYSEYVKKGFGEFILTALIIYSLLWAGLLILRATKSLKRPFLFYLQLFVAGEFAVILLSIFRRIYLYQSYHGWSLGRIYGGIFLVWVTLITICLILRHFRKVTYIRYEMIVTALIILFIGIFNAEDFIVRVHPPTVNKRTDYVYLSRMSSDGVEGWIKSFDYARKTLDNPAFDAEKISSKLDRTQVLYAGMIVKNITMKYHSLTVRYAQSDDLRDYYKEILLSYEDGKNVWTTEGKDLLKSVGDYLTKLNNPSFDIGYFQGIISVTSWNNIDFEPDVRPPVVFYSMLSQTDSNFEIETSSARENFLDRIYLYNLGSQRAYQKIKENISIADLVKLQKRYIALHEKISRQPVDDRTIEQDISLASPFL